MKKLLWVLLVLAWATPAFAQTTTVIDASSKAVWGPSPDENGTFGTPPINLFSNYRADVYLKSAVTVTGTAPNQTFTPTGTPAFQFNWPKTALDANGLESSPPLKPLVTAGQEYYLFLSAAGPGGVSTLATPAGPFGSPSAPRAAPSVRIQ